MIGYESTREHANCNCKFASNCWPQRRIRASGARQSCAMERGNNESRSRREGRRERLEGERARLGTNLLLSAATATHEGGGAESEHREARRLGDCDNA